MNRNIWRVAGIVMMAGLALFLLSVMVKLLLVAAVTVGLIRVAGGQLMKRLYGAGDRRDWQSSRVIAIDNPGFQAPANRGNMGRIIPIS